MSVFTHLLWLTSSWKALVVFECHIMALSQAEKYPFPCFWVLLCLLPFGRVCPLSCFTKWLWTIPENVCPSLCEAYRSTFMMLCGHYCSPGKPFVSRAAPSWWHAFRVVTFWRSRMVVGGWGWESGWWCRLCWRWDTRRDTTCRHSQMSCIIGGGAGSVGTFCSNFHKGLHSIASHLRLVAVCSEIFAWMSFVCLVSH